jgi:hypothetical protein
VATGVLTLRSCGSHWRCEQIGRGCLHSTRGLLALLAWIIVAGIAIGAHAQPSITGNDQFAPPSLGTQAGDYIAAAAQRNLRMSAVRQALQECGQCADRSSLEAESDRLQKLDSQVRAGEGVVLQALHLPYKDFRELAGALYKQSLGQSPYDGRDPPELVQARAAMTRAIANYCYATSNSKEEEAICRRANPLSVVAGEAISAAKGCFNAVEGTTRKRLDTFPTPNEEASVHAAHAEAWLQYNACVRSNDYFATFREETNRICRVADLGPALEPADFICACTGKPRPERAICPSGTPTQAGQVIEPLIRLDAARKLASGKPYGPDLLGIRIGMPLNEVEAIIRQHMEVGQEFSTGLSTNNSISGVKKPEDLARILQGLQGHLFVSKDGFEYFALFEARPVLPERVFAATRAVRLEPADAKKALMEIVAQRGNPDTSLQAPFVRWGGGGCSVTSDGDFANTWQQDGVPIVDDRNMIVPAPVNYIGLPHTPTSIPFNRSSFQLAKVLWRCDALLSVAISGNPGGKNRPMIFSEKVLDPSLLDWFQRQLQTPDSPP